MDKRELTYMQEPTWMRAPLVKWASRVSIVNLASRQASQLSSNPAAPAIRSGRSSNRPNPQ